MNKKRKRFFPVTGRRKLLFRTMKLTTLLILAVTMQLSATVYSQSANVSLKVKHADLETVLRKLEKSSQYSFFYSVDDVASEKKIDLDIKDQPLGQVLSTVLSDYNLVYSINNNLIVLKHDAEKSIRPLKSEASRPVKIIRGTVTSAEDHAPMPGVSVFVKGNPSAGTSTDAKGNFQLSVSDDAKILTFSMAGYKTREIAITDQGSFNVEMSIEVKELKDVVVTGYQKVDKRTFTGSVGKIGADKIQQLALPDVGKMLQGQVAGVSVEIPSSTFGSKPKIRIRGSSSISGNKEPLWVVDGVVLDEIVNINPNQLYSGDASDLLSSAISGLNPSDIADIQVLKDASATAMYGTQAVNGVIVITTKRGRKGAMSVNYRNNSTLTIKPTILDFNVLNSKQRMEFSEDYYLKNPDALVNFNSSYGAYGSLYSQWSKKQITDDRFDQLMREDKMQNTDWFKELFHNSLAQEHSLSLSGGTDQAQYYTSVSLYNDNGQTDGQNTHRYTANMNATFNINKRLTISPTLYMSARNQRVFGTADAYTDNGITSREFDLNPYSYAMSTSRAMRPFDKAGNYEYYLNNYVPFNVLQELQNNFVDMKTRELKLQADVGLKLSKNLTYSGLVSGRLTTAASDHSITERSNTAQAYREVSDNLEVRNGNPYLFNDPNDVDQYPISVLPRGGILIMNETRGTFYTVRNSLNWKPTIGKDHVFDILAGTELRHKDYENTYTKGYGYEFYRGRSASPDYRAVQRDLLSGSSYYGFTTSVNNEFSYFANTAYTYLDRYNFSVSLRSDGSNRLGKTQRFKFLPTWQAGTSWNLDRENFLSELSWLDILKLRASYGLRGNIGGIGSSEMLVYYGKTNRLDVDTDEPTLYVVAPDNPNLRWEKEHILNVGLDFGFFNKLNGSIEYYDRREYDQIGSIPASMVTGFANKNVNWASMKNSGLELTLNFTTPVVKNLSWNTVLTWGYNKNTVLDAFFNQTVLQATGDAGSAQVGRPLNGLYSFRFAGLDGEGLPLFYDEKGEKTSLINRYSTDMSLLKYEGSRDPLASGGFTNTFRYKAFSLSMLLTYSYGNKIRLLPFYQAYYDDVNALSQDLANRWTTPGDEIYTNVPRILDQETYDSWRLQNADPVTSYNRSTIRVADGSYVRLKNVSLGYNLPKRLITKAGIKNAQFQVQGQNLHVWADAKLNGQDPESLLGGTNVPMTKTVAFSLSVDF
ncbi:SusC/RagA family TonB-linked outer membrane protein [Pedobacter sp. HMF7647]|uniref:SusC/RagA family TonB-linked outer membrane protein n=1 Tax=Hufsiella arboris TaxID=2695275 RepID=A0A7K1YDA1_9SPHI|nr:SusC/RagA family TonB-linked outer membrane protein [Hufsiella arboris]MXV52341.1 SusC/RagA family TonB-linked outer membrane protein [Hufsiella arboris]